MSQPVLYIFVGYPGAGKTTAAQLLEQITGAEHVWVDRERQHKYGKIYDRAHSEELYTGLNSYAAELLKQGKSVIYDTNFSFYKDRQIMRDLAASQNAQIVLIWLCTPKELAAKRIANEHAHAQTRQYINMTAADFERVAQNLEVPQPNEQAIRINGIDLTETVMKQALGL
jgi:predicted kinase